MAYPDIHGILYESIPYHVVEWIGHYDWYDGPLDGLLKYRGEYYWYFMCGGGSDYAEFAVARITIEQANQFLDFLEYRSTQERVIDDVYRQMVEDYKPPTIIESDIIGTVIEDWSKSEPVDFDFDWEKEGF